MSTAGLSQEARLLARQKRFADHAASQTSFLKKSPEPQNHLAAPVA